VLRRDVAASAAVFIRTVAVRRAGTITA